MPAAFHALVVPVDVHQIIVLRGGACADLRPEIEGVKKEAVHPHNGHGYIKTSNRVPAPKAAQNMVMTKGRAHVTLIHLTAPLGKRRRGRSGFRFFIIIDLLISFDLQVANFCIFLLQGRRLRTAGH